LAGKWEKEKKKEYKKISDKRFKITINFVHRALKFNK
jgi:hypothetical protein